MIQRGNKIDQELSMKQEAAGRELQIQLTKMEESKRKLGQVVVERQREWERVSGVNVRLMKEVKEAQQEKQQVEAKLKAQKQWLSSVQTGGSKSHQEEKIEYLKHKVTELEKIILCTNCHENHKDEVLIPCGHVFCHLCIEK